MTVPRYIVRGQTVMVTARAVNRAFRFGPTKRVVPTILYCFAYTLSRKEFRGIAVHEFVWMSNHFHLVVTAADDSLPAFVQDLNSLMSRALSRNSDPQTTLLGLENRAESPSTGLGPERRGRCVFRAAQDFG